ncbi:MAG TPA: ammonium transporter [Chloroflexota bacterium]|nr:ammonium transporter [Chloroflexota bacterium]
MKNSWRTLRIAVAAFAVLTMLVLNALPAFADDPPAPDPAGTTIGMEAQNLKGVKPAELTDADFSAAQRSEPFAYKLASLVNQNRLGINFVWVLVTGYLVMFMQAGFALVETGFCRAKNAMHTMMMNFLVYVLGMTGFFICGFAFMMGGVGLVGVGNLGGLAQLNQELTIPLGGVDWGIIGMKGFFLADGTYDVAIAVMFLFQMVFMDTTATIPTGAMAERWKTSAFIIYSFFISMVVYPIYGNWVWGGGWLSQLGKIGLGSGYVDFAGSGVVHAVGGWTALAGAMVLGARIGKFNKDGTANPIPGHNLILATLGTFILAFGWFGFNPGSTLGASGNGNLRMGIVAVSTMIACAGSTLTAMAYSYATLKKWDPGYIINGFLAGLVAITAPSGFVSPLSGLVIGAIAGVLVCVSMGFVERVLRVDDPVGAISVHGVNGAFGQLAVGIFADGTMDYGGTVIKGLIVGDVTQLIAQIVGMVVAFAWAFGVSYAFFKVVDAVWGNRIAPEVELAGLDIPEMGSWGYQVDDVPGEAAWPMPKRGPLPGVATATPTAVGLTAAASA